MVTEIEHLTMSVEDAGKILNVSKPHAYKLAREGQMPGLIRLGRRLVVSRPALLRYLENVPMGSSLEKARQPVTTAK